MKKVIFKTFGCKVNFAETETMKILFRQSGYTEVKNIEEADIIVINSCTVTAKAERDARKLIRKARRDKPDIFFAVGGCSPSFHREKFEPLSEVDAVVGQAEKYKLHKILPDIREKTHPKCSFDTGIIPFEEASSDDPENRSRAFIKLQDGCDYFCSYCAVAYARGRSRSMEFDKIEPALRAIYEKGFRETVISGINLGTYQSGNKSFIDVLQLLEESDTDMRYRISSVEPNLLSDEIIDFVAGAEKICPHFHIPLQSGSDEILKDMKRRYDTKLFRSKTERIIEKMPEAAVGIDVITGFPTETNRHFEQTREFLESLPFAYLHVFSYSERPGTTAGKMKRLYAPGEIKERTKILRELSGRKTDIFFRASEGKIKTAVFEHPQKSGGIFGRTENYVRVKANSKVDPSIPQKIIIGKPEKDFMNADIIDSEPRHE